MFRLGDFYEMFDEDAKLTARELDLTLTTRDRGKPKEEQTPMCGVPYHSVGLLHRPAGRRRATRSPSANRWKTRPLAKGLVQRDITRIVTPGTVTESSYAGREQKQLLCLHLRRKRKIRPVPSATFPPVRSMHARSAVPTPMNVASELGRFAPSEVLRYGANVDCEVS